MSRIAAHLSGIERTLIDRMNAANAAVATSTLRLATMQKINSASDAPSAFVSLSRFQSQLTNVTAAMTNASAASSMLSQAESTVSQIQDQLDIIRDALLTPTDSSQETIDTALARINELANTEINGRRVLDGSASFRTAGVDPNQVARLTVSATQGGTRQIEGEVLTAGTQATLRYTGSGGLATADATIIITGNLGSAQITVTNGETLTNLADAINAVSYETGVTAGDRDPACCLWFPPLTTPKQRRWRVHSPITSKPKPSRPYIAWHKSPSITSDALDGVPESNRYQYWATAATGSRA